MEVTSFTITPKDPVTKYFISIPKIFRFNVLDVLVPKGLISYRVVEN